MHEVECYPLLNREEETRLAKLAREGSVEARHKLITSNLRFVVYIAHKYKRYTKGGKYTLLDLVQEGNTGLIRAVELFDYTRGIKFITYALWWIRAKINAFIIGSYSAVKIGTTDSERRLFFKMGIIRELINTQDPERKETLRKNIAKELNISIKLLQQMEERCSWKDISISQPIDPEGSTSLENLLSEDDKSLEALEENNLVSQARTEIDIAMKRLTDREKDILTTRYLKGDGATLQSIAEEYGLSRERIRQIEVKAFTKLRPVLRRGEASQVLVQRK